LSQKARPSRYFLKLNPNAVYHKEHKGKCQYKGHKEYIFGVLCIELCVLCDKLNFFSLISNGFLEVRVSCCEI
jgi:hypothetical protein